MADSDLSAESLRSQFNYSAETGFFIRHGESQPSGRVATKGYRQICVNGKRHMAHRLAWLFVHGEWPTGQIDHINQCKDDNRIANLRLADNKTQQENVANWNHTSTGFRGVSKKASGKFQADIKVDGKTIYLGCFDRVEDAATARMNAEKRYFSMIDNSPNYALITHGEVLRVNNNAYSMVAPGTITAL